MQTDPNYKFHEIADEAQQLSLSAMEIYFHFHEAKRDGLTAHREERIKFLTRQVEMGMRRLRSEVEL